MKPYARKAYVNSSRIIFVIQISCSSISFHKDFATRQIIRHNCACRAHCRVWTFYAQGQHQWRVQVIIFDCLILFGITTYLVLAYFYPVILDDALPIHITLTYLSHTTESFY